MSAATPGIDSAYAWRLAGVSMLAVALGGGSIYLPVVALPQMAAEFGGRRQIPSLAYMLGFFGMGVGGVLMGWLADRAGPRVPLVIGGLSIAVGGYVAASGSMAALLLGYGVLLGLFGNSATFTPAMNNVQGWFERGRATAVAMVSVGPAISGFFWPQLFNWLLPQVGWRQVLTAFGLVGGLSLLVIALYVRPAPGRAPGVARTAHPAPRLPMSSPALMALFSAAGFCCCAAMAVPFVHMVAFCGDLGIAAQRGAEAVSLVLLTAIAATFAMGRLAERIGPLPTSLICSVIQVVSLSGYLFVDSVAGIYLLAVIHGIPYIAIVQGYALNLRHLYGPGIEGWRLGAVMLFAMAGMAAGGWLGGAIFDATLSYARAFQAALLFNLVNLTLLGVLHLLARQGSRFTPA